MLRLRHHIGNQGLERVPVSVRHRSGVEVAWGLVIKM